MKKYGLFIGIDQYDDPEISPLTCAARDAQDLAGVFQYKFGFETAVLTHLDLKQGQRVMQKLRSFEAKLVPGDVFVLYFAGHGKTAGEADQLLLLPEVSASALEAGHVVGADVLSCLALRAHTDGWAGVSRVFIFDACRLPLAAAVASRGDGVEWDQALHFAGEAVYRALAFGREPQGLAAAVAAPSAPLAILNSCVDQGRAEELLKLGHGLFTASLLEQLQEYDESAPLVVSQTLADALGVRMQALARQHTRRSTGQRPLLHGAEVALFAPDPLRGQVRAEAVAQAQAAAQATAREQDAVRLQAGLRADFTRQLAGGQLDKPVGDNCVATLQQLQAMGQRDPSLNQALQAALDAREQAQWRESDQKQFDAANALDTPEAYADYLKHCRLCAHKEQVLAAIKALRGQAQADTPVRAVPVAAPARPPVAHDPAATAAGNVAGQRTGAGPTGPTWNGWRGGIAGLVLLVLVLLVLVLFGVGWLGNGKKAEGASASMAAPAAEQVIKDCDICPELVVIPGGQFRMGDDNSSKKDEKPAHRVTVPSFLLGKFEVTQGQWRALMGSNSSSFKDCGDNCPVEQVSWPDAQAYLKKLSEKSGQQYRLPSEAEWEYAARAGTTTAYPWGPQASHEQANYGMDECCGGLASGRDKWVNTAPVGSFPGNQFGVHDMHGNVWEWVEDCWHGNYQGAPSDGSVWVQGCNAESLRVLRGGGWLDMPVGPRSAVRIHSAPDYRGYIVGLRVARTPR